MGREIRVFGHEAWMIQTQNMLPSLHVCTNILQARGKFGPKKLEVLPGSLERLLRAEQ